MILLIEASAPAYIEKDGKKLYIRGVYLMGDKPNRNSRLYPSHVLEEAVDKIQSKIKAGQMFGSLGHESSASVDPSKISHVVKSLTKKGSDWHGKSEVVTEGAGKILRSIIEAGGNLGVSSRGSGNTTKNKNGLLEVSNSSLHAFDVVSEPSTSHLVKAIFESIATQDSLTSQTLDKDDLRSRPYDIAMQIVASLGDHPELLKAQRDTVVDWDKTTMLWPSSRHLPMPTRRSWAPSVNYCSTK